MIDAKTACKFLETKRPKLMAISCVDYEGLNLYVFDTVMRAKPDARRIDCTFSVDKTTGEVKPFQPMLNDPFKFFNEAKKVEFK